MSKTFRSLLWTALATGFVAACGDDVTITPPPTPTPDVRSVTVGPDGAQISVGGTVTMQAAVNADPGVATTVTWNSSNAAVASVGPTTGVVTGQAVGAASIRACSTVNTSVCGQATVFVVNNAPVVTGVTVVPANATINQGSTVQLVASVQGTNNPAQTVTWQTSPNPAVATVSPAGVVTGVGQGTVPITGCSTVAGFTNVCGSASITVLVPDPAQVQITSVTQGGLPVNILGVGGQIEVNLTINSGDKTVTRVDALMDGVVVASQSFSSTAPAAAAGDEAAAITQVSLSVNTRQLRQSGSLFVPVVGNGNTTITSNMYVAGSATPVASNAWPVVMANGDAALKIGAAFTLTNNSSSPSFSNISGTWFTGTQSGGSINYISFSGIAVTAVPFTSSGCGGTSTSNTITGTPTTGISVGGNWTCAAFQGSNSITGVNFGGITYASATGPDGTAIVAATGFSNIGTAFTIPTGATSTEQRWNMIFPGTAPAASNAVLVDNVAPTVTLNTVAFNTSFDQFWINGSYNFSASAVNSSDAGTGVSSESIFAQATGAISCGSGSPVSTGANLAETLTSSAVDGWRICARATDNIGNVSGLVGFSNYFGVDLGAPSIRFMTTTAPAPAGAISTVSATANTTIYSIAANWPIIPAFFGVEANDTRSGFHQGGALTNFPVNVNQFSVNAGGTTGCANTYGLPTVLADAWVRSTEMEFNCFTGAVAYYYWSAFVTDRAGNTSATIARNHANDNVAPADITNLGFGQLLYTPGSSAAWNIFATDDLEVIEGTLALHYDGNNDNTPEFVVRYPYSMFPLGTRWDGTFSNVVSGATLSIANLIGRFDTTATATNLPSGGYASRQNALPDSVYANVRDVASQPDATPLGLALNSVTQFSDSTAQPWTSAPAAVFGDPNSQWIGQVSGGNILAVQRTGTSVTVPYFDSVNLYGVIGGELVLCGTYGAPTLSDNGVFRTWQYTMTTPAGANACAGAPNWRVGGVKGNAIMLSQQF